MSYTSDLKYQKDQLAIEYLPAVRSMAFRLKERLPSFIEYADLVSIGTEELIKLARRYDESLNDSFWGYAKKRVYGSMLDYLRSLDIMSRNNRKLVKSIDTLIEKYKVEHNEEPSNAYLAEKLDIPINKVREAKLASEVYTVLPISEHVDFIDSKIDVLAQIEKENLITKIKEILETFQEREQLIIQLYYFEELNLKEISTILDITESRISQIHKSILSKIKNHLKNEI
jgi:RNA polymerase sigma factor for flagellar operon FliA